MTTPLSPEQLAAITKALSHPARQQILQTLCSKGECLCGDVVDVIGLAQSTVSQHLKVLREAGLVQGTVDGPRSCYCLDADGLVVARQAINQLFDSLISCCDGDCC